MCLSRAVADLCNMVFFLASVGHLLASTSTRAKARFSDVVVWGQCRRAKLRYSLYLYLVTWAV